MYLGASEAAKQDILFSPDRPYIRGSVCRSVVCLSAHKTQQPLFRNSFNSVGGICVKVIRF